MTSSISDAARRRTPGLVVAVAFGVIALAAIRLLFAASWPGELMALFQPYVAIAGLLVLGVGVVFRRGVVQLLLALAVAVLWVPLVVSPVPLAVAAETADFRVMTVNVLRSNPSPDGLLAAVAQYDPDVIVMQEVPEGWAGLMQDFPGYPYMASPSQVPEAVVVVSRYPIADSGPVPGLLATRPWTGGGVPLRAEIDIGAQDPLILYAIHAPTPRFQDGWEDRGGYLRQLAAAIAGEEEDAPVIVAGDWNSPNWSFAFAETLTMAGLATTETSAWPGPTRIIRRFDFIHWLGSPVDHVAVTPDIARQSYAVGPDIGSDHLPVIVDLDLPVEPGPPPAGG